MGETIWRKQELIWMGRTLLHLKKFDPQLAFKCLKACGVIRALQFICDEDKQVPAVKFIPGSGLSVFILHNFSEVLIQILSLFSPLFFSVQGEMSEPWFGVYEKSGEEVVNMLTS